ncbi:MAG: restriction endonuclease [Solirubrobacteraceae bacterium]
MRHDDPLQAKLDELEESHNPHLRGGAFEQVVAEIFTRAGFDVVIDPEAAAPRQTDLYASDRREGYLIEAKWRSDRIGSPEVDDMRSRLGRQPSHVVGVLVTMSGAAERALAEIERDRSRVIVLIDRRDVHALVDGSVDLRRLLNLKRRQLVVHAKASGTPPGGFVASARDRREPLRLVDADGSELPWVIGTSTYFNSCWVLSIPDIDWVTADGAGVTLDLGAPVASLGELREAVDHLRSLNWLTPEAAWMIQQESRTWSGFGSEGLLMALDCRDARYSELDHAHHREMLVVADACAGGWYTLLADLDASSDWVQSVELSLQLVGVPEDPGEITRLRDRLAIAQPGFFRPRTERSVRSWRLHEPIEVTPTAWVVEHDADAPRDPLWARGIVFENPLIDADGEWPALAREESMVIASLRSWHPLSEPRSRYVLERLESAASSDATLVRAIADW